MINTCCFIHDAKEESINTIIEMGQWKEKGRLKGLVVKTHGNAKSTEICNAVLQCKTFHEENISGLIAKELGLGN